MIWQRAENQSCHFLQMARVKMTHGSPPAPLEGGESRLCALCSLCSLRLFWSVSPTCPGGFTGPRTQSEAVRAALKLPCLCGREKTNGHRKRKSEPSLSCTCACVQRGCRCSQRTCLSVLTIAVVHLTVVGHMLCVRDCSRLINFDTFSMWPFYVCVCVRFWK